MKQVSTAVRNPGARVPMLGRDEFTRVFDDRVQHPLWEHDRVEGAVGLLLDVRPELLASGCSEDAVHHPLVDPKRTHDNLLLTLRDVVLLRFLDEVPERALVERVQAE